MVRVMADLLVRSGAEFSPCRTWRYTLWRRWDDGASSALLWVMLNPSTADEAKNDPTIERCQRRTAQLGFSALVVCNLFAFRATDPKVMRKAADPVGPDNDAHIREQASRCPVAVCAWGRHGTFMGRDAAVVAMLRAAGATPHCLGAWPTHPLYVPYDVKPQPMALA